MLGLIVLFILLSPGFLLTIPAIGGRYFRTNKTSPTAVIVHGIIFGLIVYLVRKYYSRTFFEGFENSKQLQNDLDTVLKEIESAQANAKGKIDKMPASHIHLTKELRILNGKLTNFKEAITAIRNNINRITILKKDIKNTLDKIQKISLPTTPTFDKPKFAVSDVLNNKNKELFYSMPEPMAPKDSYGQGIKERIANLRVSA